MSARTSNDSLARRHELVLVALDRLELQAERLGNPATPAHEKRGARTSLAAAALVYAGRVRRLARVR